jgi:hypothetical protein
LVGKSIFGSDYYFGKLGHVLVYNRKITETEMVDLVAYLVADMETFTDGIAGTAPTDVSQPVQLIMDLDMAIDVDDAAALGIAWRLDNLGECDVVATLANSANDKSASTIKAINNFYGKTACPVGAYKGIVPDNYHSGSPYTSSIASEFSVNLSRNTYPDALVVYRTALAAAADN